MASAPDAGSRAGPGPRKLRGGVAAAGPLAIVAVVLIVLHDVAFGGRVGSQHPDPLAFWLPSHCFLGHSLASGQVPVWNPHVMGGVPFAADPQSGWMYLPAMLLYWALPCGAAIRWFVILQPIVAGLGLFAFLRTEGLSRPSATVGGLTLGMAIAGSGLALSFPFAGSLAWTAVLLAALARWVRAEGASRWGWLVAVAVAWGQVAAAHLSNGLVMVTALLVLYLGLRWRSDVRAGRSTGREVLRSALILVAALVAVNLALLLPRLAYLPRTSLALGYRGLQEAAARLGAAPRGREVGAATGLTWPLLFSLSPGAYLGAAPLAASFAWLRVPRLRHLGLTFAAFGAVFYVLGIRSVAEALAPAVRRLPLGDFYLHAPWRFRFGVLLALCVAVALGIEAWRLATSARDRAMMLLPGLVVWGAFPLVAAEPARLAFPALGLAAGAAALWSVGRRPRLLSVVPGVLLVELAANAFLGQASPRELLATGLERPEKSRPFTPLLEPDVDVAAYLAPTPTSEAIAALGTMRFLARDPGGIDALGRGYLRSQRPEDWGLLANQRAMLFGLEDAQGYNPTQPLRYWTFVRTVSPVPLKHNAAVFVDPPPMAFDLLQVGAVVTTNPVLDRLDAEPLAEDGPWVAASLPDGPARASVVGAWTKAASPEAALAAVVQPGFASRDRVVLEEDPGIPSGPPRPAGRADLRMAGPKRVILDVVAERDAILLIRSSFDPNWQVTVDRRPVPLLAANGLLQAVAVDEGRHTVELLYDDPWVGRGVVGSAMALAALAAAAIRSRGRGRGPVALLG
jgi:hypothetical protein